MSLVAMTQAAAEATQRELSLLWGVVVPGLILACSVLLTWLLYRHFSKPGH
jgi:hypothetical protein